MGTMFSVLADGSVGMEEDVASDTQDRTSGAPRGITEHHLLTFCHPLHIADLFILTFDKHSLAY